MTGFLLPTLSCSFPSKLNKYSAELEEYSISWLNKFHILREGSDFKRFRRGKFFMLTASTYPYCQLEELKLVNDWIIWLFNWDEQCDVSSLSNQPELIYRNHKRFLEILKGVKPNSVDLPLSHALYDIRKRLLEIDQKKGLNSFVYHVEKYFQGCVQEAINRQRKIVPDLDTYLKLRQLTGAMNTAIELMILCNHLRLPSFLLDYEIFRKLTLITNQVVCWDNDIISAYREIKNGDVHNLIFVLHHHKQISLPEAMKLGVEMRNQELENMIRLEASLPSFGEEIDTELAKYISGLHAWIRGNLDWSILTDRYQSTEIATKITV